MPLQSQGRNTSPLSPVFPNSGLAIGSQSAIIPGEMRDELRRKITETLAEGIKTEKDLVYFLVEIRKLMERDQKYKDPVIESFSDWIVHTTLSRQKKGTTEILQEFDLIVTLFKERTSSKRVPRHFNFDCLQTQLRKLLKHFDLPTELTDERNKWIRFLFLYASVVRDCPITLNASNMQLKYIKKLELQGYLDEPDVKWKVILNSGETSSFSVRTASFEPPLKRRQP
jgi:hypothetical protein